MSYYYSSSDDDSYYDNDLLYENDGYVACYIDGACPYNGQRNACAGIGVVFNFDHPRYAIRMKFILIFLCFLFDQRQMFPNDKIS